MIFDDTTWTSFRYYRSAYRNYLRVIWWIKLRRFPIQAVLRDGRTLVLQDHIEALHAAMFEATGWPYDDRTKSVTVKPADGSRKLELVGANLSGTPVEVFHDLEYAALDVAGRTVIDVGASIGDSTIYFARRGALKTIGLEPYPIPFEAACQNVARSGLEGRIELRRALCGPKEGTAMVSSSARATDNTSAITDHGDLATPVVTLDHLASQLSVQGGILKLDCEGGEYEILQSTPTEALARFDQLVVEYHDGVKGLADRLALAGFSIKMFHVRKVRGHEVGLILAENRHPTRGELSPVRLE
ncbi:MAG: FkbM family methyltransferase [Euryarchaeota archaeon]|nr:FkbM family methyltransferase [Euryarchaeota archaeon]MDE1837257.1 FkbM family methyltransferase [Euryarchaeota archaeon]MDE1879927.1 FkbM family methyltransferase [Euryarchaeota archaeon]MDE2045139.1 FkbM family methyltransferase [Thermoplasmata archaeon]